MTPSPAALQAAERFNEIEELHGENNKRRWAMFDAALTKFGVDEFEVECALEWLEERALEL
jgi:hypothetical protein